MARTWIELRTIAEQLEQGGALTPARLSSAADHDFQALAELAAQLQATYSLWDEGSYGSYADAQSARSLLPTVREAIAYALDYK